MQTSIVEPTTKNNPKFIEVLRTFSESRGRLAYQGRFSFQHDFGAGRREP
jgi:hypothetical protein